MTTPTTPEEFAAMVAQFNVDTAAEKWCRCDRNRCEGDGLYRCVAKAVKGEVPCHWSPAGAPEGGEPMVDIRSAVEGAMCYDCGCESDGPKTCERVIAALRSASRVEASDA